MNVARQAALKAGLPNEVPAETINRVCGSGLQAVAHAVEAIRSGYVDIVVAAVLGGALAENIGLTTTLWIAAGAYLATTLVPFIFPVWREMDRRPAPAPVVGGGVPAEPGIG